MKTRLLLVIVVLTVSGLFLWFVYPTPHIYTQSHIGVPTSGGKPATVRTNRFTGDVQILTVYGWIDLKKQESVPQMPPVPLPDSVFRNKLHGEAEIRGASLMSTMYNETDWVVNYFDLKLDVWNDDGTPYLRKTVRLWCTKKGNRHEPNSTAVYSCDLGDWDIQDKGWKVSEILSAGGYQDESTAQSQHNESQTRELRFSSRTSHAQKMKDARKQFIADLKERDPAYSGWNEAEIEANVKGVLESRDSARRAVFFTGLQKLTGYKNWQMYEIEEDVLALWGKSTTFKSDIDAMNEYRRKAFQLAKGAEPSLAYSFEEFNNALDDEQNVAALHAFLSKHYEMSSLEVFKSKLKGTYVSK